MWRKKFRRVFIVCWEGYVKYGKVKRQLGINAVDFLKSPFSAGLWKFFIICTAFQDPFLWWKCVSLWKHSWKMVNTKQKNSKSVTYKCTIHVWALVDKWSLVRWNYLMIGIVWALESGLLDYIPGSKSGSLKTRVDNLLSFV